MKKEPAGKEEPPKGPIVQPMIDELSPRPGPPAPTPTPAQQPEPKAAELDQDPGGGFNPDHTDIQT
jgi:hypothetical protein